MSRIIRVFEGHFKKGMSLTPHQTSIEHQIMARSKVLDVAPGYIKVHYELDSVNDINPMGMLHGGMTATLIDSITTWCNFVSREGHAGVTTDLSVSYLKGIDPKKHPTVTLVGRVDQAGRQLAFCSGEIRSEDGSILFATGKQTKAMVPSPGPLTVLGIIPKDMFEKES